MKLETALCTQHFERLNRYTADTQRLLSASAASVLVIRDGLIVNEWYNGTHELSAQSRKVDAASRFNIASIRKTYLGFAVSLALHEGKIKSVDDPVQVYLDGLDEKVLAGTTIRHLLTHTHGLASPTQRLFPPGASWKYNNAGVNLLIDIVQRVYGLTFAELIIQRVLQPCRFSETGWCKDNREQLVWLHDTYDGEQGREANLFVTTRELGYWGWLHHTKGNIQGKQLLPPRVFEQISTVLTPPELDVALPRNGFFWWVKDDPCNRTELGEQLPKGSFQSIGLYGNILLVIPEYNAVAVRMLNQIERNPAGYHYPADIQTFGDQVVESIVSL
ncbi:MAG: class beta-lactamase-related serine hydrolase [Paenibacillus sp.]|nr:class beta-lactamase-related serine hydrolase [Paenibacillus sp.]